MTNAPHARISFMLPSDSNFRDGAHAHRYEEAMEWQQITEYEHGFCARLIPLDENHSFPMAYDPEATGSLT